MTKRYAYEINDPSNSVKSRIDNARVSFKNTRETSRPLVNMKLDDAIRYLNDVIKHKRCVPMRRYARGVGRTAQAKEFNTTRGRWPQKSAKYFIELIENLKANAASKKLDPAEMVIRNIVVNKAHVIPGRLHRAHGRINPYNKSPCHIQLVATKHQAFVPKIAEGGANMEIAE